MFRFLFALSLLLVLHVAGAALDDVAPVTPAPIDPSKAAEQTASRQQALAEDGALVERARQEVQTLTVEVPRRIAALTPDSATEDAVEQARVDTKSARLRLEDLKVESSNTEQRIRSLVQTVRDLEARVQLLKNPAQSGTEGDAAAAQLELASRDLGQRRDELGLEQRHLEQVRAQIELMTQRAVLLDQWQQRLEQVYRQKADRTRREEQADRETQLQREQQAASDRAAAVARQLTAEGERLDDAGRRLLELDQQVSIERAKLAEVDIRLLRNGNEIERIRLLSAAAPRPSLRELASALDTARSLAATLRATAEVQTRKVELYRQQEAVIQRRTPANAAEQRSTEQERHLVRDVGDALAQRVERVQALIAQAGELQGRLDTVYRDALRRDLLSRRALPTSSEAWLQVADRLAAAPYFLAYQLRLSVESAVRSVAGAGPMLWVGLVAGQVLLLRLALHLRRRLRRAIARQAPDTPEADVGSRYTDRVLRVLQELLKRNVVGATLSAMLVIALWGSGTPQPSFGILATLALLWAGVKLPMNLARLLLLEGPETSPAQRGLYRQIALVLLAAGILGALAIITRLTALADAVIDLADQLFMLHLALSFPVAMRVRRHALDAMAQMPSLGQWFMALRLTSLLLSLTLLTAAVLGLAGYINLAWEVARQLLVLTLVLALLIVVLGLLDDLFAGFGERLSQRSGYSREWTAELLDPLHHIVRVLVFCAAVALPLYSLGISGESALVDGVLDLVRRPFAEFGSFSLSPYSLGISLLGLAMLVWVGRLLRAVTYRWVLSGIADSGVRNSLAVFTQYLAVTIGLLVMLRMLGVDLTTLAVFAGAVGVGIGFGLQNIANNFLSGVLLLIERPLRRGDIVKIGSDEGEIDRIGIRSLTMKTFDNMEVIIPNADVITHPFTNWTHSDNIIRQVLYFDVAYDFDPHRVQDVLAKAVAQHPGVQINPAPMTVVWGYGELGIKYCAHYYVDLKRYHLLKVRSEVNLAVWDAFKKAGIAMLYPRHELHIRSWPSPPPMPEPPPAVPAG